MKRTSILFILLLTVLWSAAALEFEADVLSPAEGNWVNAQPLVIDKADDCEVYYSLTGSDPLKFGFAYDGPILLEGTGTQILKLVSVSSSGVSDIKTIRYSCTDRSAPSYIPVKSDDVYIRMTERTRITIPDTIQWAAGVSADSANPAASQFSSGGVISLNGRSDLPRIIPLILKTAQGFYRYLMRVGTERTSLTEPVPEIAGLEFAQWNYIRFNGGRTVLYSVDGSPLQQTSSPVWIDRTVEHTITWKPLVAVTRAELEEGPSAEGSQNSSINTVTIPAKPQFSLPERSLTNDAVLIQPETEGFVLSYTDADGSVHYQDSLGVATVPGDSFGVVQTLSVYWKGMKQGTVDVSFLINRRNPAAPTIISDADSAYSDRTVTLTFQSAYPVFYRLDTLEYSPYGFDFANIDASSHAVTASASAESADYLDLTSFQPLETGEITLVPSQDAAMMYRVLAYAKDAAGNVSSLTTFLTVIDGVNLYVAADRDSMDAALMPDAPYGSMNNPFSSISEAFEEAEQSGFINPRIFLLGTETISSDLVIRNNCRINGKNDARLILENDSVIKIQGVLVNMSGITVEKSGSAAAVTDRKKLLDLSGAMVSLYDCELYASFASDGTLITSDDSAINIKKCGLTSRAGSYSSLISANATKLFLYGVRGIVYAQTSVGINAEGGISFLAASRFAVIGSLGRIAEYSDLSWVMEECVLQADSTLPVESALWTDAGCVLLSDKANTLKGFSRLYEYSRTE